nr:unnamed protein product [Callosobruchus analis]
MFCVNTFISSVIPYLFCGRGRVCRLLLLKHFILTFNTFPLCPSLFYGLWKDLRHLGVDFASWRLFCVPYLNPWCDTMPKP